MEKNIPYEKGVKDLKVDMKAQTVTVTFREDKNTQENIQKAIEKLKIPVNGVAEQEKKDGKEKQNVCRPQRPIRHNVRFPALRHGLSPRRISPGVCGKFAGNASTGRDFFSF